MTTTILAVLDDEELLGTRYPTWLPGPTGPVGLRSGSPADLADYPHDGVIVDTRDSTDVRIALDSGVPALVGMEALAALCRTAPGLDEFLGQRSRDGWLPFLPTREAVDVRAAAGLLADGAIGTPVRCELTTYVGRVAADPRWEQDAPFARSVLEALVFGLDLAETLLGRTVSETTWSRLPGGETGIARHVGETPTVQQVLPARLSATPLFTASVIAEDGRLLLRHEFAPGALTIWDARAQQFRSPALPRMKDNVQAPDTALGGVEVMGALTALLQARTGPDDTRRQAARLVGHAVTTLPFSGDDSHREEPE